MNRSFCSAVLLSAFITVVGMPTASADDVASDAGPAPANCPQPDGPIVAKGSKAEIAKSQQRVDDYKACVNAYTTGTMAKAKELQAQAQTFQNQAVASQAQAQAYQTRAEAYATAANRTVETFNTYINNWNARAAEAEKK